LLQVFLARQQFQHRVLAQLFVIIQVFLAQGQRRDTLRNHFRHRMPNPGRGAAIQKALCQARQQIQPTIGFPQQ
jgi:hypothetical protein